MQIILLIIVVENDFYERIHETKLSELSWNRKLI